MPLYKRSPKKWPVLFTILKQVHRINCIVVGEGKRTTVTLVVDFYDDAVKLKDWGFVYYHSKLKCLLKYIEGN